MTDAAPDAFVIEILELRGAELPAVWNHWLRVESGSTAQTSVSTSRFAAGDLLNRNRKRYPGRQFRLLEERRTVIDGA